MAKAWPSVKEAPKKEHIVARCQHRRRRITLATHQFRSQMFVDITSYEVTETGIFLPRSTDRITVVAALVPDLLRGIAKAKHVLELKGAL